MYYNYVPLSILFPPNEESICSSNSLSFDDSPLVSIDGISKFTPVLSCGISKFKALLLTIALSAIKLLLPNGHGGRGTVAGGKVIRGTVAGGKVIRGTVAGGKVIRGTVAGGKVICGTVTGGKVIRGTVTVGTVTVGIVNGSVNGSVTVGSVIGGRVGTVTPHELTS